MPARLPMAVEAAFHAGQGAVPVGLHRSVRVRRAMWVAAELTRPRPRRRWLGGLFFSSASGWRQTDASGPAGRAGAIARRGRRRCRRMCSSCSATSPEGWGDARLGRGRARRSAARASRLRFRVALRFRRPLAPPEKSTACSATQLRSGQGIIHESSASHRSDASQSSVSHQPVIPQPSVSHHSVITRSSLSHPANRRSSVGHRSVTGQS